jgi:hypothetical protein
VSLQHASGASAHLSHTLLIVSQIHYSAREGVGITGLNYNTAAMLLDKLREFSGFH